MDASADEQLNRPSTYDGQPIPEPERKLTPEEQLQLLDTHPLFTGRCPECEMPIPYTEKNWHCDKCGWKEG